MKLMMIMSSSMSSSSSSSCFSVSGSGARMDGKCDDDVVSENDDADDGEDDH